MKFLVVTCVKENQDDVVKIFKAANIFVFSATDVTGFNQSQSPDLMEAWFAAGEEKFDSLMLFSFTANGNAEAALELIKTFNEQQASNFPVRAFIVPVEKSNY